MGELDNNGRPGLRLVSEDLPEYPLRHEDRLETHYFVPIHYDRLLNSQFGLTADQAVFGLGVKLFLIAQKQSPIGTLPDDDRQLAALLHLDVDRWLVLRGKNPSPLYKWTPCRCGHEIRLMHPVVLEVVTAAHTHKLKKRRQDFDRAQAGRLKTLAGHLEQLGKAAIARDPFAMEWMDEWLAREVEEGRRRTVAWTARAVEALCAHMDEDR